jgi:MOSC domain-containing protein YiiM
MSEAMYSEARGRVVALSISRKRGTAKRNVAAATFVPDWGIEGDAHAGAWHRQVSLLGIESFQRIWESGVKVRPGGFGENITTEGIALRELVPGTQLRIGSTVILEVTQVGKECTTPCTIAYLAGECVMPREGIFARVIVGGVVRVGDEIRVEHAQRASVRSTV